jgi:DNA-binding transcriptional ArsR family regulator
MIEAIFGNRTAERVLLYLSQNEQSYGQEISDRLGVPLNLVQRQLRRLEEGGVLAAQSRGRMRFFSLNPRYPFTPELRALLQKAIGFAPAREREQYSPRRDRPRATRKAL